MNQIKLIVFIFLLNGILALMPIFHMVPNSDNSGNNTLIKKLYANLMTNMLTGTKNVRWETLPMNYMDSNGKPVAAKSIGTKTPIGCPGNLSNKVHGNNETYKRENGKFLYRCNNGIEEVVACIGSSRTNNSEIAVGQTLNVNDLWHKCETFPNGSVIYTQASSCSYAGKEYAVGAEINAEYLRLKCEENGYKLVGCYYFDENKKIVLLDVGEKREVEKIIHYCEKNGDTLQYFSKANGCTKDGKDYKINETFSQNHLQYKCVNGGIDILGCYINEKRDLALEQDIIENNFVYRCYRSGNQVEYTEYACGLQGTPSCKLKPIPKTSNNATQLINNHKISGFGSFAFEQHIGGGNSTSDKNTLKIEIDKLLASHH